MSFSDQFSSGNNLSGYEPTSAGLIFGQRPFFSPARVPPLKPPLAERKAILQKVEPSLN
jgi:hypothetical protein